MKYEALINIYKLKFELDLVLINPIRIVQAHNLDTQTVPAAMRCF